MKQSGTQMKKNDLYLLPCELRKSGQSWVTQGEKGSAERKNMRVMDMEELKLLLIPTL